MRLNKDVVPNVAETLGATKTKTLFTVCSNLQEIATFFLWPVKKLLRFLLLI